MSCPHTFGGDFDGGSSRGNADLGPTPFRRSAIAAILEEMTVAVRAQLPEELKGHFNPTAPRVILQPDDTTRVADGLLPSVWFERAARASGPPSLQVAAMEAAGPGLRWPGGRPAEPSERRRLYEMQIDWLGQIAWNAEI